MSTTQLPTPTAPLPESDADAQARIARIEQRMLDAEAVRTAADTATRETKTVAYPSYEAALAAGREVGASRADDNALMALFCEGPLQTLVGAVSPELVWDGAQRQGLTTRELGRLANTDMMAVSDLQWVDDTPTAPLPAAAVEAMRSLDLKLTALRFRDAAARCSAASAAGYIEKCLVAQDEMRMCLCQLRDAGRLDLVGGA